MLFLAIYPVIAAIGIFLAYLAGRSIEVSYGPQVSLIAFLVMFFVVLIGGFPLAVKLTPNDKPSPEA